MNRILAAFLVTLISIYAHAIGVDGGSGSVQTVGTVNCSGSSLNIDAGTLYVDCSNNRVGVGTTAPATVSEVNGPAQFGSGATKSTFTASGHLQGVPGFTLLNSSLTVQGNDFKAANIAATGQSALSGAVTVAASSTLTVTGNAFSVGGSTLAVLSGGVGVGTTAPTAVLQVVGGGTLLWLRTKAQIDALTPSNAGELIVCSNCALANYELCIATGTAVAQYMALANSSESGVIGGGKAGCGTNN